MKCCLFCLVIITACANNTAQTDDHTIAGKVINVKKDSVAKEEVLVLEAFQQNGKLHKGCNAAFAEDMAALDSNYFLLLKNSADKALIQINGRKIALKLDDKIEDGAIEKEVYKGSGYMLHLIMHKVKKLPNGRWLFSGEVLLLKNKMQQRKSVIGTAGC